jgi:hypothetical protein
MKKYLSIIILVVLCACNSDSKDISEQNSLKGKWLWVSSSGGFAGTTPAALKQKTEIEFSGSNIKTYIDGKLSRELKYFITTKKSIFGGNRKMIVIDKGNSITQESYADQSFEIIGKNLVLSEECNDCYVSVYLKTPTF